MTIEQFRETLMAVAISPEYLEIITKKRKRAKTIKKTMLAASIVSITVAVCLALAFAINRYSSSRSHLLAGDYTPYETTAPQTDDDKTPEQIGVSLE